MRPLFANLAKKFAKNLPKNFAGPDSYDPIVTIGGNRLPAQGPFPAIKDFPEVTVGAEGLGAPSTSMTVKAVAQLHQKEKEKLEGR